MTAGARLPGLDTLRALAICGVVLFHLKKVIPERLGVAVQFGWMGVDLFFVLSGYLIGAQLLKLYATGGRPSLKTFYKRRAFRILPAYLAVLLLYFTWPAWSEMRGLPPLWQFLTFTQNLFFDPTHRGFSHAWSLCVEEHFYLVFPLLVLLMMRRPTARRTALLLASVMLFGIVLRALEIHWLQPSTAPDGRYWIVYLRYLYYPTYARLDGLLVGVTLAVVHVFRPAWWGSLVRRGHTLLAAGLLLIAVVAYFFRNDRMGSATAIGDWDTVIGFPILSIGLGLLVVSSVSTDGLLARIRVPGAALLATLAYSLYLTHKEIILLDWRYLPQIARGRGLVATLLYGVSCLAAAALLHLCVERPFLMLRDRMGGGWSPEVEKPLLDKVEAA